MQPRASKSWSGLIGVFFALSCGAPTDPWVLADGRSVRDILPRGAPAMLILVDPSDYSQCNPQIPLWIEAQRAQPKSVHFVFIRQPTEVDLRQAALLHLRADGILAQVHQAWEKNGRRPVAVFWTENRLYSPMPMRAAAAIWRMNIQAKTTTAQAHDSHPQ